MPAMMPAPLFEEPALDIVIVVAYLAATAAIAWWCARIATRKGRNATAWAILGVIFPLAAVITILILPPPRRDEE